jgi:hypothetical protein
MKYKGGCHCRQISFEVEGELEQVIQCNCSICSKRGALLWFVPHANFHLLTPEENLSTYTFNKHVIKHRFCAKCGCAPYGEGANPKGEEMVAINTRCLDDVDLSALKVRDFDGQKL